MWQIERTLRWCQHSVSEGGKPLLVHLLRYIPPSPRIFLSLSTVFEWVLIPRLSFTFSGGRDSQESFIKFHLPPPESSSLFFFFFSFFPKYFTRYTLKPEMVLRVYNVEIRWSVWFLESEYMKNLGEPHLKWKMHKTKLFNLFFRSETAVESEWYLLIRY